MDLPQYYTPPAAGISTPAREEIVKGGFLKRGLIRFAIVNTLAAPAGALAKGGRWALPAGELFFSRFGLAFITQGKRIGRIEQFLGGSLFWVFKNVGVKFVEPLAGAVAGEEIVSTVTGLHEWSERREVYDKYKEGFENPESLFLPINQVVSLSFSFEPNNMYGIIQLDVVIQGNNGAFTTYNFLAREEDGDIPRGIASFIYFLRLSYEQHCFQTSLFRRYANASLEMPDRPNDWSLATLSFKPEFYQRAAAALKSDAPLVASIRREALAGSHAVISRLRINSEQLYNVDTPFGKLFDLAVPEG